MPYFDLFVAAVPTDQREAYTEFCIQSHPMMRDLGATEIVDCWGDDTPPGEVTSLPMAVKAEDGETVVMGWVVWPDKATRDAGWAKMMNDMPEMEMPFDGKRMIFGGFTEVLSTRP
ncbi:DUF1428 domain-containing protein [Palleronia abyssalis]|uniref:RNA signal recognition particle 4.5S RNA n=1 Tax=Palleronia abyssalis TaxID=1501240 RepID=A0A2R8BU28_9RHOB|nr:DUF1428 domain-containing protein [Palleronia abyssalis]SPJ23677.1 hypothetical protein PAA8504_01491 [Palleronia abyssalis]